MIPADNFRRDGDIGLWVPTDDEFGDIVLVDTIRDENRPCDTCRGVWPRGWGPVPLCLECDGTGRHTFEVQYQAPPRPGAQAESVLRPTLRVHVIDVIRIIEKDVHGEAPDRYVYQLTDGRSWLVRNGHGEAETQLDLPPAGEPGRWLALLAIHPGF